MRAALVIALLAGLLAAWPVAAQPRALAAKCRAPHTKTVFRKGDVRVFTKRAKLADDPGGEPYTLTYACKRFPFRLPISDFPGEDRYYKFAAAGNYIGYAVEFSCAACDETNDYVYVHDLRTGKAVIDHDALCAVPDLSSIVTSLKLAPNGTVTWTATGTADNASREKVTQTVTMKAGAKKCTAVA